MTTRAPYLSVEVGLRGDAYQTRVCWRGTPREDRACDQDRVARGEGTVELTLDLYEEARRLFERLERVRGTAASRDAEPVCAVTGWVREEGTGVGVLGTVLVEGAGLGSYTNREGAYGIYGVPAGPWWLRVEAPAMAPVRRRVDVACRAPGEATVATFDLRPAAGGGR